MTRSPAEQVREALRAVADKVRDRGLTEQARRLRQAAAAIDDEAADLLRRMIAK